MLSKEAFCELMKDFEEQYIRSEEWVDKVCEVFGCDLEKLYENGYFDIAIRAIEMAMECKYDSDDNTWISWWIYENEWGENHLAVEIDGEDRTPTSYGDLYDLIVEENECDS